MNEATVKRLILSIQAEIEGMKADNLVAEKNGLVLPYEGTIFLDKANDLKDYALRADHQL